MISPQPCVPRLGGDAQVLGVQAERRRRPRARRRRPARWRAGSGAWSRTRRPRRPCALRRRPAVSMKLRACRASRMSGVDRVARGAGHRRHHQRSSPRSRLISDDLPTLGRPTTATLIASSSSSACCSAAAAPRSASSRSPLRLARSPAETRNRVAEPEVVERQCWRGGVGQVVQLVHDQEHRPLGAAQLLGDLRVDRMQAVLAVHHEARSGPPPRPPGPPAGGWPGPSSRASRARGRRCPPARSDGRPSRPSPKCRSRVVPASSETMARRPPRMRLKSVDLPTLGRPTMATVGMLMRPPARRARP